MPSQSQDCKVRVAILWLFSYGFHNHTFNSSGISKQGPELGTISYKANLKDLKIKDTLLQQNGGKAFRV